MQSLQSLSLCEFFISAPIIVQYFFQNINSETKFLRQFFRLFEVAFLWKGWVFWIYCGICLSDECNSRFVVYKFNKVKKSSKKRLTNRIKSGRIVKRSRESGKTKRADKQKSESDALRSDPWKLNNEEIVQRKYKEVERSFREKAK